MSSVIVSHTSKITNGQVNLPASKSIANRLLLMKAIAGFADMEIQNLSNARDTQTLHSILNDLDTNPVIDVHDAGTVMRFLTAYLSSLPGQWILTGTERMQQRPIGALVNVLRSMGAEIEYVKNENYPPLKIQGKKLCGGRVEADGSISSQFISALLMIAPLLDKPLELHLKNELVSVPYIEMTLKLMQQWGARYNWKGNIITVENRPYIKPAENVFVESDWSAASYFYSILSLAKQGEISLPYLFKNSLQGDSICAALFTNLGVSTEFTGEGVSLRKTGKHTANFEYDFLSCPDIAQTLAVCCAEKKIKAHLKGLQTLSIKETDRILALKTELKKAGIRVLVQADSIQIDAASALPADIKIDTYRDHRMAMSFAPMALCCGKVEIENPAVVEKSFPHFWDELKKIGFTVS